MTYETGGQGMNSFKHNFTEKQCHVDITTHSSIPPLYNQNAIDNNDPTMVPLIW